MSAIISDIKKRNIPSHIILKIDDKLLSQLEPSDVEGFSSIQVVQTTEVWDRYRDEILTGLRLADNNSLLKLLQSGYAFSFDVDRLNEKFNKTTLICY